MNLKTSSSLANTKENLSHLTKNASIRVREKGGSLLITPVFRLNRFNLGILLFLVIGVCFILLAVYKTEDATSFYIMFGLGIFMVVAFALSLSKDLTDFMFVTDGEIVFRNNFRKRRFPLSSTSKIKVKGQKIKSRIKHTVYHTYIIDIFLKRETKKYRLIDFQTEGKDKQSAIALGEAIKLFIDNKIGKSIIK